MTTRNPIGRRRWLAQSAAASLASHSWLAGLARAGATAPSRQRSVIMLWLTGGPATIDLWDLKPGHQNGGPFRPIHTAVPGIQISEHLPDVARQMGDLAIVRSMTGGEGDHTRATHVLRTGYAPQGAIRFPALGALVAQARANADSDLPAFVSVTPSSRLAEIGSGFVSPRYAPLAIGDSDTPTDALTVPGLERPEGVSPGSESRRMSLLRGLDHRFAADHGGGVVESLSSASKRAYRLMQPAAASVFDLDRESSRAKDSYGRHTFGQGCLLARRLVERGVPFVEVALGGWDTHRNNFTQVKRLSGQLDRALAALIRDLKQRGLLESTLIVCQGEFGRTPVINRNRGRDHWPGAWSAVLAGGGISGGQTVGSTTEDGIEVDERPVTAPDLIATVCSVIGIDPRKQNMSNVGRPIRISPPDAKPIGELL